MIERTLGSPTLRLDPAIASVEDRIKTVTGEPGVSGPVRGLIQSAVDRPGKRLRPFLVLCSAGDVPSGDPVEVATAVELIHTASLIHDDVMDGAGQRRGKPALHQSHGVSPAILAGDFLFAWAFKILSRVGVPEVMPCVVSAVEIMCAGQACEWLSMGDTSQSASDYWRRITKKTAAFTGACCKAGALVGQRPPSEIRALTRYGLLLGLSFQLRDDLMDLDGDPDSMGKPVGSDLRAGILTLPVLYAMKKGWPVDVDGCRQPGTAGEEARSRAIQAVLESGGIAHTRMAVRRFTQEAVGCLKSVSDDRTRIRLSELARRLVHRSR